MKRTKQIGAFIAGILALAMVVGSWAYFSSDSSIKNDLSTDVYGGRTVEEFTPDQKLQPGAEVTKTVGVTNTGDYDLVVRIKMDEKWSRDGAQLIAFASEDENSVFNTVARTGDDPNYAYHASQGDDSDGELTDDESIIYKTLNLTNWVAGGDGYWYYTSNLTPGASTGSLLKSLVMADNADMGNTIVTEYYSTTPKATITPLQTTYDNATTPEAKAAALMALEAAYAWKPLDEMPENFDQTTINFKKSESTTDSDAMGYADADYSLTITTELCQATADAVQALWGAAPAGTSWSLS